jgi:hypothetical protein
MVYLDQCPLMWATYSKIAVAVLKFVGHDRQLLPQVWKIKLKTQNLHLVQSSLDQVLLLVVPPIRFPQDLKYVHLAT